MNQETFKETVFVLKDKMYRFAKSILTDEDEAHDLVQELLMKFWQKRDELISVGNLEAFAMRCVRNDAMNKLKHTKVVQLYHNNLSEAVVDERYPSLTKELIQRLIAALPEKQKLVMHLRDIEDYDIAEIGETIGMEESAVRVNLMRARQKVKGQLQKIFDYEKDKSTKIEDRYWEGVSSLEEEKILKRQKDEPYFDGLNELSKEKMDLEFGSFMDMLEEPAKIVAKKPKYRNLLFFAYGAAAIALFVTGFFFLHDKEEKGDSYQQPQFSSVKIAPKLVEPQESEKREAPYYVAVDTKHTKEKKHTKHIATPETVTIQAEEPADDSFVIVNGKPVYDEEEAEQIVLASLKIMASNFQEGKHALEKVKYINVEL